MLYRKLFCHVCDNLNNCTKNKYSYLLERSLPKYETLGLETSWRHIYIVLQGHMEVLRWDFEFMTSGCIFLSKFARTLQVVVVDFCL